MNIVLICHTRSVSVGKCDNPLEVIQRDVIIGGYKDPALEGENITFTCLSETMLSGPNSSMCTRNGKWDI